MKKKFRLCVNTNDMIVFMRADLCAFCLKVKILQTCYNHIILNIQVTPSCQKNSHNGNVALIGSQMQRGSAIL